MFTSFVSFVIGLLVGELHNKVTSVLACLGIYPVIN
jgi:hypothetical protein